VKNSPDRTAPAWLEELRDQRAHLRLALVMMRVCEDLLLGIDHDADVTDWSAALARLERTFDAIFDWVERQSNAADVAELIAAARDVEPWLKRFSTNFDENVALSAFRAALANCGVTP
jgi:hypothetical protein